MDLESGFPIGSKSGFEVGSTNFNLNAHVNTTKPGFNQNAAPFNHSSGSVQKDAIVCLLGHKDGRDTDTDLGFTHISARTHG